MTSWGNSQCILQDVSRLVSKLILPFFQRYVDESGCSFTCWRSSGVGFLIVNFFWVMFRSRYRLSLAYRLSLVCTKFKFSLGIQLFYLKTTWPDLKNSFLRLVSQIWPLKWIWWSRFTMRSGFQAKKLSICRELGDVGVKGGPVAQPHPEPCCVLNLTLKINFFGQVYHVKWFSGQKSWTPEENLNLLQTGEPQPGPNHEQNGVGSQFYCYTQFPGFFSTFNLLCRGDWEAGAGR